MRSLQVKRGGEDSIEVKKHRDEDTGSDGSDAAVGVGWMLKDVLLDDWEG